MTDPDTSHVLAATTRGVRILTIDRPPVNALDRAVVARLHEELGRAEQDSEVRALVLTGRGAFFSFGFDIPSFLKDDPEEFSDFLRSFTELYPRLFMLNIPVVAALNGHTIAGGCMLALACDRRLMATGRGRIALNEVTFGASLFAGSVEMLIHCVGARRAELLVTSGRMIDAEEAQRLELVDATATGEALPDLALATAEELGQKDTRAFASIKRLCRGPIAERMRQREPASLEEFVQLWYSESTRAALAKIVIRN